MSNPALNEFMRNSSLVYFEPTKAFFDFFRQPEWRYRRYHDCGAGSGFLTQEMHKRGLECLAYDLHPRDESFVEVEKFDTAEIADRMDLSEVALLARPCHHSGLIDATICSALQMGDAFYVGKPERIGEDLVEFHYEALARDVGKAGEVLIRIKCDINNYQIRRCIIGASKREEWWWYNPNRRRYTSEPKGLAGFSIDDGNAPMVVKEELWTSNLQSMHKKADLCKDTLTSGWLAPDGEFFGCGYMMHDIIAREVIGCSVQRLERLGFARLYDELWTIQALDEVHERKPTTKQKRVLRAKGYEV